MPTPPFPLGTPPSYYRKAMWTGSSDKRNGVHYVGETVTIRLESALAATTNYEVRNYFGEILSSGSVALGLSSFTPTVPSGGWDPGWYRVYLISSSSDTNYSYSSGATNFCVIRSDSHFVTMPAGNVFGSFTSDFAGNDLIMKGVMGIGTTRLSIANGNSPTTGSPTLANVQDQLAITKTYWTAPGSPYADSARPRYAWVDFPNGGYDKFQDHGATFLCKDETIDGSKVFVEVQNGTTGGTGKIRVHYPSSGTVVETYDNLNRTDQNTIISTVNGASSYIRVFNDPTDINLTNFSPTAIGNAYFNGVKSVVSTLYPDVVYFEGPQNEPGLNARAEYVVLRMRLFYGAVKAGNANAKAIGPCPVTIDFYGSVGDPRGWYGFFSNGGHNYTDEISFHAYNAQVNGDINLARYQFQTLLDMMDDFSVSKPLWQTESTHAFTCVYGMYHPRRAKVYLLQTLLMEQYGIVKEKNNAWYDASHGFWSYPAWFANGDGALGPQAVLLRVLAEETWGKQYASALDFGSIANSLFIGNVYSGAAGKTVALQAASFMPDAQVLLTVSGASGPFTLVDGLGNESSVAIEGGVVTIPMTDIPMYLRLPSAASVVVNSVNDWGAAPTSSLSSSATTKQVDGVTYSAIADDGYMTHYDDTGIAPTPTYATPPGSTVTLQWSTSKTFERVVVWCGPVWQLSGTMIDFDVQTFNGSTWTTVKNVTRPDPSYFAFGGSTSDTGCFLETYWDEQWIFDVALDAPVTCLGLRLSVNQAAYGGEPLSTSSFGSSFGQGTDVQSFRIQEVAALHFENERRGEVSWAEFSTQPIGKELVGMVPI